MRSIAAVDIAGILKCSSCPKVIKRSVTGQIDGLAAQANMAGWKVDENGNILCPDCVQEKRGHKGLRMSTGLEVSG